MNDPGVAGDYAGGGFAGEPAPAVALNSVGFNVARAVGPALGGMVMACGARDLRSC